VLSAGNLFSFSSHFQQKIWRFSIQIKQQISATPPFKFFKRTEIWTEWFEVSGFSSVSLWTDIYGALCVWEGKGIGLLMEL
jgi:hypothetical protein